MIKKLSMKIYEHNAWFFSLQDDFYSWFTSDDNKGVESFLGDTFLPSHTKYILDNGKYSFLLVGLDGKAEKLTPAFELSEENIHFDENRKIINQIAHLSERMELVRYLPAKNSYEFPLKDESDSEINELFLAMIDDVADPYLSEIYSELGEEEGVVDITSKEIFKTKMIENLAQLLVSYYYQLSWDNEAEECGGIKAAFERFLQGVLPLLCKPVFNTTKEEMLDLEQDDDSEVSDGETVYNGLNISASGEMDAIKNIKANTSEAYIAACAVVMVCDNELDESELMELFKASLKSELAMTLVKSLGAEDLEDVDTGEQLGGLLEGFDMDTTQNISHNVNKAWEAARLDDSEYELIDYIAEKIGDGLSSFVLASCLDTAASDGRLQEEERFVLARFASKWGKEDELCDTLQSMTNKLWKILTVADKQILIHSDDVGDVKEEQQISSDLWEAIQCVDVKKAMELIAAGELVNEPIDVTSELRDITPLMVVAEQFEDELCQALIDAGADINAQSSRGYVPLTWALKGDNIDNFKLLLAAGADLDPLDSGEGDFSPLSMAAKHGLDEAVKMLIGLGVDVNKSNADGVTAIKNAAISGNASCVELLLDAGANPDIADNQGFAAIHNAVDEDHLDIVKLLVEHGSNVNLAIGECPGDPESEGKTPLMCACLPINHKIAKWLIEKGADANIITPYGQSAIVISLLSSMYYGNDPTDLVELLLNNGADVNVEYQSIPLLIYAMLDAREEGSEIQYVVPISTFEKILVALAPDNTTRFNIEGQSVSFADALAFVPEERQKELLQVIQNYVAKH